MSSLATRLAATADRLLNKFDERTTADQIQISRPATGPTFNPVSGEDEFGSPVLTNVVGVQTGDQLLKLTAEFEPLRGDQVIIDGVTYLIVKITPVRYTDTTISYTVHIRK